MAALGPLGSLIGPLLSTVMGSLFKGGGNDAAPPPPPPEPESTEPEGALDQEAVRQRALRRRREQDTQSITGLTNATAPTVKTLLGE